MFEQISRAVVTAGSIFLIGTYTYGVAKISAKAGLYARGNPIKERVLSKALGIELPESSFTDFVESLPVPGGQCEVEQVGLSSEEPKENKFWVAFKNLLGEREEEKE